MREKFECIERLVQEVYDPYSNFKGEVPVIKIAKDKGFSVAQANLELPEQGFILINNSVEKILGIPTQKLIVVNSKLDTSDKRFVIAHELGHYCLHGKEKPIYAHRDERKGKDQDEQEADYFAACLLMPSQNFSDAYKLLKQGGNERNQIVSELASKFNVPLESVLRRIDELKLELDAQ